MKIHPLRILAIATAVGLAWPTASYAVGEAAVIQGYLSSIYNKIIQGLIQADGDQTRQEVSKASDDIQDKVEDQEKKTRDTITDSSKAQRNNSITIYNRQLERAQQPLPFCPDDQTVGTKIAKANSQNTYNTTVQQYNKYNASQAVRNPATFVASENDRVQNGRTATCDPRIVPPISKGDVSTANGSMHCTDDQINITMELLSGRKPMPQPPSSLASTATGQQLKREIDYYNARHSLIEQTKGTMSEEMDTLIKAFEKLTQSPSIEQINQMSGTGAVERTQLFQQQIQNQLLLLIFKEQLQQSRLSAVIASQGEEEHLKTIQAMIRSLGGRSGE